MPRKGSWRRLARRRAAVAAVAVLVAGAVVAGPSTHAGVQASTCAGFGFGPQPDPGGGIAFPDSIHGWVVGSRLTCQGIAVILATNDGGLNWSSQRAPLGVGLSGVSFVNASQGWAAGTTLSGSPIGAIFATHDGGANWARQTVPTTAKELVNVSFINGSDGWAVGGGSIVATVNGGATWTAQTNYGAVGVAAVAFANPSVGWAVGLTPIGAPSCFPFTHCPGYIVATTNGGAIWSPQTVPANVDNLEGVTAASLTEAWATGEDCSSTPCTGVMLHTTNGGSTWTRVAIPSVVGSIHGIDFLNSSDGWAVGDGFVLATTDGGTTWLAHTLPGSPNQGPDRGVDFTSPTRGWIAAISPIPGLGGSMLASTDGGSTWASQTLPTIATTFVGVAPMSVTHALVPGQTCNIFGSSCSAAILTTSDGGGTWSTQPSLGVIGPGFVDNSSLSAIVFPTPTAGWAVGLTCPSSPCAPLIIATSDGGRSWGPQTPPWPFGEFADVAFVNASDGWAVGSCVPVITCTGNIAATTNGGATWTMQSVPGSVDNSVFDVDFVSATTGWALANCQNGSPCILKTTNGGTTWSEGNLPNATIPNDVTFVNASDGWLVGASSGAPYPNVIDSTIDGGMTWKTQKVISSAGVFNAVDFIDTMNGWAVGDAVIYHTSNGGVTWKAQTLPNNLSSSTSNLSSVAFADASNGWAVGVLDDEAVILHTTNGGATWTQQTNLLLTRTVHQAPPPPPGSRGGTGQSPPTAPGPGPRIGDRLRSD